MLTIYCQVLLVTTLSAVLLAQRLIAVHVSKAGRPHLAHAISESAPLGSCVAMRCALCMHTRQANYKQPFGETLKKKNDSLCVSRVAWLLSWQ